MSNPFLPLIFLLGLSISFRAQAQTSIAQDIKKGWKYSLNTLDKPFEDNASTVIITGTVLLSTGLAYIYDEQLSNQIATPHTFTDGLSVGAELLGNPWVHMGALGSNYLIAKCIKDPLYTDKSIRLLSAAAFTGVSVQFIKLLTARARPYIDGNKEAFFTNYFAGEDYLSFPSGHTALAFSLASSLAHLYEDQQWLPFVVYPLAAITGWSRIYDSKHWASDVVLGTALGYYVGKCVAQQDDVQLSFAPTPFGGMGLSLSFSL